MDIKLHKLARTTPATRQYIQTASQSAAALARELGVAVTTIYKWKHAGRVHDGSHVRHQLHASTTPEQEALIAELRAQLRLSLDDVTEVMNRCSTPRLSRSAIHRCLRRLGLARLPAAPQEPPLVGRFAATPCGYIHLDLKVLTKLQKRPSYVLVAIDRATRYVWVKVLPRRTAATVTQAVEAFLAAFPHPVHTILTDNDGAFTDRFAVQKKTKPADQPSGTHQLDQLCRAHGIKHRLIRPYHPQTNGMVERFNRRLSEALQSQPPLRPHCQNRFRRQAERNAFITRFVDNYNRTRLKCLNYQTPLQLLQNHTGQYNKGGEEKHLPTINALCMNNPFQQSCDRYLAPLFEALTAPGAQPLVLGAHGPALAFILSLLRTTGDEASASERPFQGVIPHNWLILTPTQEEAESLCRDMAFFFDFFNLPAESLAFFPDRGQAPYEAGAPSIDLTTQRMRTLFQLQTHRPTVVIATPQAALQYLIPQSVFAQACLTLKAGSVIERESLLRHLLRTGYRRVSVVDIPGEFSVRGGIVDIFSTGATEPYRIEFLGDTVESARQFDPGTQESTESVLSAVLLPAREYLLPDDESDHSLVEMPPDAEWRLPDVHPSMATLLDYFPAPPFVVMDRPIALAQHAREWTERLHAAWEEHDTTGTGVPYPAPAQQSAGWDEFLPLLSEGPLLAFDVVAPSEGPWNPVIDLPLQSARSVGLGLRGTSFTDTLAILERLRRDGPVVVVVRSSGQVGRLSGLFAEHHAPTTERNPFFASLSSSERAPFYILQGFLSSGFVAPSLPFAVVTEEDLFAKIARHRPQPKSKTATFLSSLEDLNAGDYVVHVQHGIGRYKGLRRLSVQDFESDYLILEFAGRDTLYVPLDRLNQVQKFRGSDRVAPTLDKLGGTAWARTKARVKKAIEDMTDELVELYADREVVTRHPYQQDGTLSHEFEAAFDYEETPDQIKAIDDIQRDLRLPKPMDRLVCGDVGYGKTEVAMRAAFQAVQDNRQVAVLVPTTLLAQQHSETFTRRFAPFPIHVGTLSRFQTPKEVKALLSDLASGIVDIVIGTHRLLHKNVRFKNLGLVIIDEEQWFGVRHKERLKQLRTQVDVLTLTATPIPRTLQMAFSGVRDLSVIDTPPPGRLAIRTQVVRFNPNLIRDATRRELARQGQVFYVHNRVETIERTAAWLRELVPEARLVMAHGQMNEHVLEGVMLKFFHGEADILVATSIIQSGLDVPRANTILVDRADTFGLAQLYQLRGRVGRAGDQAYAYFFFPNEEILSTDAQRRLLAIQEFADLGSGFRIAAADLEIRGAGNLLGKQQSGNIAAVGFDLYMQMVEQAVQQRQGEPVEEEIEPTLHVPVSAFIPDDYVEDGHQRLSLYKRLSASQTVGDLALLHGETQDRYGTPPEQVEQLFQVMQIRLLAKKLNVESLDATNGTVTVTFASNATIAQESLDWLMQYSENRLQFLSPVSFAVPLDDWPAAVPVLTTMLNGLLDASSDTLMPSRP